MLVLALALALPQAGLAHESEQYSLPIGRDFADLGPYLSKIVHGALVDAVSEANGEIAAALDNGASEGRAAALHSGGTIAGKVWTYLFLAIPTNELLDLSLVSEPVKSRYPGLVTMYRPPVALYDDPLLAIDLTKFVRTTFRAGTVSAGGELFGTDKLVHFINVGRIYHSKYASRVERGMPRDEAVQAAIASTSRNPLTSEDGFLGMLTTGIYSNGDLAADFAGLAFYRNLTETVRIGGRTLPPMLERDGPYWRVKAAADSDFFTAFITPHWNEVLNPNRYAGYTMGRLRALVAERCADAIDWYRDRHGRQRTREQFEALERELSTHYGENYGHKANRGRKVTIASVCFAEAAGAAPATAQDGALPSATGRVDTAGGAAGAADDFGRTALWWAARVGDADLAAQLVAAGADPNAADVDGETPLHAAARAGSAAVARELVARGADPNRAALYGVAPVMLAAAAGKTDVGVALLQAGADPNARDLFGRTALHESVQRGDLELIRTLLAHGAEPQLADDSGRTAQDLIARLGPEAGALLLRDRRASAMAGTASPAAGDNGSAGRAESAGQRPAPSGDFTAGASNDPVRPAAADGDGVKRNPD